MSATVRIWTRESCALHSVGEAVPGLQPCLAWQPNCRHLYAAQASSEQGNRVVLFETNGLQHGGFSIPGPGKLQQHAFPLRRVYCLKLSSNSIN